MNVTQPPHHQHQPLPKKPYYKRVWFWLVAVLAVIVVISVASALGSNSTVKVSSPPTTSSTPTSAPTTRLSSTGTSPTPYAATLGQPVRDGVYAFTARKFECGLTKLSGGGQNATTANGQFCVAVVDEENVSNSPQPAPFDATMTGADGKTYDNDTDPVTLTAAQLEFISAGYNVAMDVNPGTVNHDVFVWDVPAGVRPATVTFYAGFDSNTSATVNVGS